MAKKIDRTRLLYINFEDDRLFPLQLENLDEFIQAYYELFPLNRDKKVWFFLDEVQEIKNWEKFVRRIFDKENCRIYITGSSSKFLSRELSTALCGCTLPYKVFPLNFNEFLIFNKVVYDFGSPAGKSTLLHWFDRWLKQGGFPELVFLPEELHNRIIDEYLDLMLYRDLTERFSIKNTPLFKYLMKFAVSNVANQFSISKTYNDLKSQGYTVSRNTIYDYLSYFEEAFMIFRVET